MAKYKAIGKFGAVYLCNTYEEAISKAASPSKIFSLDKRVRKPGRPRRNAALAAGCRVAASTPWVAFTEPDGYLAHVRAGDLLVVLGESGGNVKYRLDKDLKHYFVMAKKLFYPRVRPERELRKNAGGRKLRPVTPLTPTEAEFKSDLPERKIGAMFNFVTEEPSLYEGMVRRTARYIAKKIVDGIYDHEDAPNVWRCTAASAIRHVALAHGIDDIFVKYRAIRPDGKGKTFDTEEEANKVADSIEGGYVTKVGYWDNEDITQLSMDLANWFIEQLYEDKITLYDLDETIQGTLNVFGEVNIRPTPSWEVLEGKPQWTVTGNRDRFMRPQTERHNPAPLDDEAKIEAKLRFARKQLDKITRTLASGKVVPLPSIVKDARIAALRKKLTTVIEEPPIIVEPEPEIIVEPEPEPVVEPEPEPVVEVEITKPEDLTVEEAYNHLLEAMTRLHAIQAADPKARDKRGVNTTDMHVITYMLKNWGMFQDDPDFPQGLAQLLLKYAGMAATEPQLTPAEVMSVLRLLPRVAKLGRYYKFDEYVQKEQKLKTFIEERKLDDFRAGKYQISMHHVPMEQGGVPVDIPGYAYLSFPEEMSSHTGRELSADVVKKAYPEGFSAYEKVNNRYLVRGNRTEDLNTLGIYMKEKGGTLTVDSDVLPIKAHPQATRAMVMEFVDTTDKEKWGEQAKDVPVSFFNLHHTIGQYDPAAQELRNFVPGVKWRGSKIWERPWERPKTWAVYGLTKKSFEEFRARLRKKRIDLVAVGPASFAVDPREHPKKMIVTRAASNVEFAIPEGFAEINVPMEDEDGNLELINLSQAVKDLLIAENAKYIHANRRKNIPGHYILEYAKLNKSLVEKFKKIPALDTSNIEQASEEIKIELADRFAREAWSKTVPLVLPEHFRFGKWKTDAPGFIAKGGDLKPPSVYPYQEEGIRFLLGDTMRILGDDRGLGKTIQSIIAADTLRANKFPMKPVLVVVPSRLIGNFYDQLQTFSSAVTVTTKKGKKLNAVYVLDKDGPKDLEDMTEKAGNPGRHYKPLKDGTYAPPRAAFIPPWAQWIIVSFDAAKILREVWKKTSTRPDEDFRENREAMRIYEALPSAATKISSNELAKLYTRVRVDALKPFEKVLWDTLPEPKKKRTVTYTPSTAEIEGVTLEVPEYKIEWRVSTRSNDPDQTSAHNQGYREKITDYEGAVNELYPKSDLDLEEYMAPLLAGNLIRFYQEASLPREVVMSRMWDLTIFDEAHAYKEAGGQKAPSGTYLFARELMKHTKNAWFLTGTPIANKIIDLWALFHLTSHELGVGENYMDFGMRYAGGEEEAAVEGFRPPYAFDGLTNMNELKQRSSNVLLWRYKDDVAGIPVQQLYKKELEMPTSVQTRVGVDFGTTSLRNWDISEFGGIRSQRGARRSKILGEIAMWKAPFAIEEAINAIEEGHKVILFSSFSDQNYPVIPLFEEKLAEYFAENPKKKFKYVVAMGSVSKSAMAQRVRQFTEDANTKLLVGNIKTAGTGLNLQAATYSIFNDVHDSPSQHEQAEDRTRRINQLSCTEVVYMISDAIEDGKIWDKLWRRRLNVEKAQEGRDDPLAYQRDSLIARVRQMHPEVPYPSTEFNTLLKFYTKIEKDEDKEWA